MQPSLLTKTEALLARAADWIAAQPERKQHSLAFATGAISAFSFAPFHLFPLMPLAFAVLVWLLDASRSPRKAALIGWLFGFGQFTVGLYWIAISFRYQSNMPAVFGIPAVLLLTGLFACYMAVATAAAKRFWTADRRRILVLAVAWVALEWLRGHLFTGFPWNLAGNAWLPLLPVAQAASLFGIYGLSLLMVLAGGAVAVLADRAQPARRMAALIGLVIVAFGLWGGARLVFWAAPVTDTQLHIIQADIGQEEKWDPAGERRNLWAHLELTNEAIKRHGPGIVIWPETAIQNFLEDEPSTRYLLSRHIEAPGALITGGLRVEYEPDGTPISVRNSLFVLSTDGDIQAAYDKAHLVPFGEYLPFRSLLEPLGLARLAPGAIDFVGGPGPRTLEAPGIPAFGPQICYEIIFPGAVINHRPRPAWMVNISNDAWFGYSTGPYQHLSIARMRAIEEGLPLVRATPTGVSAIIDSQGRLTAYLGLGERGALTGRLPAARPITLYAQLGDTPLLLSLLVLSLGLALSRRTA